MNRIRRSGGYVLLTTLVLLTLAGAAMLAAAGWHTRTISRLADAAHGAEAAAAAAHAAIKGVGASGGRGMHCSPGELSAGRISVRRSTRYIMHAPANDLTESIVVGGFERPFPAIDYNDIFSRPSGCVTIPSPPGGYTHLGFPLTPAAPLSRLLCVISDPLSAAGTLAFSTNLTLSAPLAAHARSGEVITVAAAGYLESAAGISVSGTVHILAGGDVHISELTAEPDAGETAVVIVSARGYVALEGVRGDLRMKVAGWSGIRLPPGIATSHADWPPLRSVEVIAVAEGECPISRF